MNVIPSAEALADRLGEWVCDTTAIVCIGSELRGDDAAGVEVAQRLAGRLPWRVFDARNAPENFLMPIARAAPASVVVIDAVHFAARCGEVALFEPDALAGDGPSTHGPAPIAFLESLAALHPCRRVVVGIQGGQTAFGAPLSGEVLAAVEMIAAAFDRLAESRRA